MLHIPRRPLADHMRRTSGDPTIMVPTPQTLQCVAHQDGWKFGTRLAPGPEYDKFASAAARPDEGRQDYA
ncbi:hypothetical protein DOTSEDRAFT_46795 [Dothistroma septosporum NZE10]|uniref:Uncharacterized protein n=1 Tax=Dothistroma septosporum (strain NZE10 / CBS 128990) TaxID=675120 RepID=N1PH48_DOTSN|nr:hypothetical protein DOTSEDRAFT_46795 [Dothistroma septosporum NZE10]